MFVFEYKEENCVLGLLNGYFVVVNKFILFNNKMFKLWMLVWDNKFMIVEDLYILYIVLFICLYNNKVNKLKGKFVVGFK